MYIDDLPVLVLVRDNGDEVSPNVVEDLDEKDFDKIIKKWEELY